MQFPLTRLYWRMALYIGTALLAFVVLSLASVYFVAASELETYTATKHGGLGREAAKVLAVGGRPALEQWLREDAAIPNDVTVYVLDTASQDIRGLRLPELYANFVRRSVVGTPSDLPSNYQPVRLAPQLLGPSGERYTFLVLPKRITLLGNALTTLGLLAAAMLVIATVAWWIARAVARPLGELQQVVRELASGQIDARVPATIATRQDELGALAADVNRMAAQIAGLLSSRSRLMSDLSHELRSPLARLQAALGLAAHNGKVDEPTVQRIEQEIRQIDRVIGDLLKFSRVDSTAAPLQQRLVRLDELLVALARDEEIEATAHACKIELALADGATVVGDPELLRSGFENILRNAIRHAPAASVISIGISRAVTLCQVTIADRGPGVPPDYLARIFDPYFRVPDAATGTGTGLGLAIARRVFEVHQGGVVAEPRDGGGLTIRVWLPTAVLV
ncbi:MAG: HAMP domain-containing histidine kinase [Proteobacteria bacterium]|nr:HAMP domain-containing histidine kinase [Pseudomonadota bacterium]